MLKNKLTISLLAVSYFVISISAQSNNSKHLTLFASAPSESQALYFRVVEA